MVDPVSKPSRRFAITLAALTLWIAPPRLQAHRLDEYLQATLVAIEPGRLRLEIDLTPGVAVAGQVLALIDRNHDGFISTNEAAAYANLLRSDLEAKLDGRPVELSLAAMNFPAPGDLRAGLGIIQLEFVANAPRMPAGQRRLTFENRHLPKCSVYLFNAALPRAEAIKVTRQIRNQNQSSGEIDFTYAPPSRPWIATTLAGCLSAAAIAAFATIRRRTTAPTRFGHTPNMARPQFP